MPMSIDVARRLLHRVTVIPIVGQSDTAEATYGAAVTNVACFIERHRRRILRGQNVEVPTEYDVMFLPGQALAVGDKLVNGVRRDGTQVLDTGVVESIDDVEHPVDGRKLRVAAVRTVAQG